MGKTFLLYKKTGRNKKFDIEKTNIKIVPASLILS